MISYTILIKKVVRFSIKTAYTPLIVPLWTAFDWFTFDHSTMKESIVRSWYMLWDEKKRESMK